MMFVDRLKGGGCAGGWCVFLAWFRPKDGAWVSWLVGGKCETSCFDVVCVCVFKMMCQVVRRNNLTIAKFESWKMMKNHSSGVVAKRETRRFLDTLKIWYSNLLPSAIAHNYCDSHHFQYLGMDDPIASDMKEKKIKKTKKTKQGPSWRK